MIAHIITDSTAIRLDGAEYGVRVWRGPGDIVNPGFAIRRGGNTGLQLLYILASGQRIITPINLDLSLPYRSRPTEWYYALTNQPENDWHRDPDTGQILAYRYLDLIEWVFD
jgi:hypothetical protein